MKTLLYLIFDSFEDAQARSEEEGIRLGLAYHKKGSGTRYATSPRETIEGNYALPVNSYELSEEEQELTVEDYIPPIQTEE